MIPTKLQYKNPASTQLRPPFMLLMSQITSLYTVYSLTQTYNDFFVHLLFKFHKTYHFQCGFFLTGCSLSCYRPLTVFQSFCEVILASLWLFLSFWTSLWESKELELLHHFADITPLRHSRSCKGGRGPHSLPLPTHRPPPFSPLKMSIREPRIMGINQIGALWGQD